MKHLTLYTKPSSVNQRYGIINGRNILTKRYRDTKTALALEIRSQVNFAPLEGHVALNIMQYFGDKRRRDIDAYLKILLDAMEGIVYEDDTQITEMHVFKEYDKNNPRIEIQVL